MTFIHLASMLESEAAQAEQHQESIWTNGITPPNFDEFITSEEFLGQLPLSKRQIDLFRDSIGILPENIVDRNREISTLIALWSKGGGKGLATSYFIAWFAYILLSLNDFYKEFTFARGENVDIINVAPTAKQATNVVFAKMKDRFNRPCFEKFGIVIGRNTIRFDKSDLNLHISSLTADTSLEGFNVIAFVMDESSGYKSLSPTKNADYIYNVLESSARTRFNNRWVGLCISYPRRHDDFTMRMYDIAKTDNTMYAMREVIWNLLPWTSSHDFDHIKNRDPEFYACSVLCQPPKGIGKFIDVDTNAYLLFRSSTIDPVLNWTPIKIQRKFEKLRYNKVDQEILDENGQIIYDSNTNEPLLDTVEVAIPYETSLDYVGLDVDIVGEKISGVRYFGHGDPSNKKDSFTFVVGHSVPNTVEVVKSSGANSNEIIELNAVVIDAILEWRPDRRNKIEVDFINVRDTILALHSFFNFDLVTFDRWNSVMLIQSLIESGIHAEDLTFSRNQQFDMYLNLKNMIAAGGVTTTHDDNQFSELADLEIRSGRIDHPEGGSKDIADGLAVIVWHCSGAKDVLMPVPVGGLKRSTTSTLRAGSIPLSTLRRNDVGIPPRKKYSGNYA